MTSVLSSEEIASNVVGDAASGLMIGLDGRSLPYKPHPAAEVFKLMAGAPFDELVEDVRQYGVRRPIVLLDGMVLDGRNRYLAAREAGVGYSVVEYVGDDPLAFVISENRHRRHETESERAMSAAKMAKLPRGRPVNSSMELNTPTQAEAAKSMDVSVASVKRARAVLDDGAPELVAAVDSGVVSIRAAAAVATLPETEQQAIVEQGPHAVVQAAKLVREAQVRPKADKSPPTGLSGMTRDGLEAEVLGLREENEGLRKENTALKLERDSFKTQVKDLSVGDQGAKISALHAQLRTVKLKRDDSMAEVKRMEFRLNKALERVKELESMEVSFG